MTSRTRMHDALERIPLIIPGFMSRPLPWVFTPVLRDPTQDNLREAMRLCLEHEKERPDSILHHFYWRCVYLVFQIALDLGVDSEPQLEDVLQEFNKNAQFAIEDLYYHTMLKLSDTLAAGQKARTNAARETAGTDQRAGCTTDH